MRSRIVTRAVLAAAGLALVWPALAAGQSWRTITSSRQLEDNDEVRVYVEYGAGHFKLQSADDGLLYSMSLRYDEEAFEPITDFSGDRLRIGVETVGRGIKLGRRNGDGELDLKLARGVPLDLDLEFGAVRADLDFGGMALTDLDLSTGASESNVDVSEPNPTAMEHAHFEVGAAEFTARHLGNLNAAAIDVDAGVGEVTLWLNGRWEQNANLSIEMGLGALELRIPEGLGVRLRKQSFLTSLDPQGLVKRGDAYYSLDWENAERRVTIDLQAAFGSVDIVWIR
jgi:hypothetical protein